MLELVCQMNLVQFSKLGMRHDLADVPQDEAADRFRETAEKDPEQSILELVCTAKTQRFDTARHDGAARMPEADCPVATKERVFVLVPHGSLRELAHGGR